MSIDLNEMRRRTQAWRLLHGVRTPSCIDTVPYANSRNLPNAQIEALENHLTANGPTWMGFCHNDTQYGNMLLHTASEFTLGAQDDAIDLLDTHSSFEEQPSASIERDGGGFRVELGSSPPSFASLLLSHVSCSAAVQHGTMRGD
jgi:hypothetical protein